MTAIQRNFIEMKKYLPLLSLMFLYGQSYSQDIERMMTKKHLDCSDIIYNSTFLIPEHLEKNNSDTITAILNYWENRCGISEPLLRLKILFAINADTLNENIYERTPLLNYLVSYRERIKIQNNGIEEYRFYNENLVINNTFDNFTKELALKLQRKNSHSDLDNFFLDYYSNNFDKIFLRLQDTSLADSKLGRTYLHEANRFVNIPEGHFSVYSGVWIPNGNLSIIGNHPIIGFQGGVKNKKGIMIDATLEFRFGNSPNTYFVKKNDSLYSTTHFFGGFIGVELGYELMRYKLHELDILGGCGWDGFDALEIGKTNDPNRVTKSINALNLNLGVGYRKYLKNKSYVGIEMRYNVIDYQNRSGTDLTGNTVTVRLKFGTSRNLYRDNTLMRLDHKKIISDEKYYDWLQNGRKYNRWWY
jgi:hypothetical protein